MATMSDEIEVLVIPDATTWRRDDANFGTLQRLGKRALDVAGALALIVLLAPIMLVIAAAIKIESSGPVIFKQRRVGRYGTEFIFHKFRTMRSDAEERFEEVAAHNEHEGPIFKLRNDPRRTRVGAFLRKTSLDELPNLFDVLSGRMSLVGPRPPLPLEVAEYSPNELRRLEVKPGITGLWQVSGRSLLPWNDMVRLDLEYVDSWSIWLDLTILVRTVPAVVSGRGAF